MTCSVSRSSGLRVVPLPDEKALKLLEDEDQRQVTRDGTKEAVKFISQTTNLSFCICPHRNARTPVSAPELSRTSLNGVYGDWVKEVIVALVK